MNMRFISIFLFISFSLTTTAFSESQSSPTLNIIERFKQKSHDESFEDIIDTFYDAKGKERDVDDVNGGNTSDIPFQASPPTLNDTFDMTELQYCRDDKLGVRILCNREWGLEEHQDALFIVLSVEPAVTFTITQSPCPVTQIEQLHKEYIDKIGEYRDDFQIENIMVNKYKAMKVNAYSEQYSDMRLLDFYVIHDSLLYGFLFSVNPKDQWNNYIHLFEKIIASLEFI